jgi:hypothetical protein
MYREDRHSSRVYEQGHRYKEIERVTDFIDAVGLDCWVDKLSDELFPEILRSGMSPVSSGPSNPISE